MRTSLQYYQYYHSMKPVDPRLPPPLYNWCSPYTSITQQHYALERIDLMCLIGACFVPLALEHG